MCMFGGTSKSPAVQMPKEPAQMRQPDGDAVRSTTSRRQTDRLRAAAPTVLTGGQGVMQSAQTEKKTLLGA